MESIAYGSIASTSLRGLSGDLTLPKISGVFAPTVMKISMAVRSEEDFEGEGKARRRELRNLQACGASMPIRQTVCGSQKSFENRGAKMTVLEPNAFETGRPKPGRKKNVRSKLPEFVKFVARRSGSHTAEIRDLGLTTTTSVTDVLLWIVLITLSDFVRPVTRRHSRGSNN